MSKPIIGITLDIPLDDNYSKYPWYALRQNYGDVVTAADGIPLFLHSSECLIQEYCECLDGIIFTGGDFDIDPQYYNEKLHSTSVKTNNARTAFEMPLMESFLKTKKPILGICAGMQLLNVIHGGSLCQDIEEATGITIHQQCNDKHLPTHKIEIVENTLLSSFAPASRMISVNSSHHQAIKMVGDDLIVNAVAEDGIIEAIALKNHPFCLGVQWHPEYCLLPYNRNAESSTRFVPTDYIYYIEFSAMIFKNFIDSCVARN